MVIPSTIPSIYELEEKLRNTGLSEKDILYLLQRRIKGHPPLKQIKETLQALKRIERTLGR